MLPPLASAPPTASPATDNNSSTTNSSNMTAKSDSPPASPIQTSRVEPLLINHVRFAYAFKKNDAAKILPFLHKDVVLQTVDCTQLRGNSAVLAYLVGPRMAKLSTHMHIKGSPTRSSRTQTKFIYDHGMLFRQALYTEVIEWTAEHLIAAIAHVAVPDGKASKAEFLELSKSSTPLSASTCSSLSSSFSSSGASLTCVSPQGIASDDDEEPEHQHLTDDASALDDVIPVRRAKSCGEVFDPATGTHRLSRASSSGSSARLSTSSNSSSKDADSTSVSRTDKTLKIKQVACVDLAPIRSRKRVNPFVTIRTSRHSKSHWKSSVARHDANPTWSNVPVEIQSRASDDAAVLEISLWDFVLFKSVKVATAVVAIADLFAHESDEFTTSIQLERMELTDTAPPVQLTMTLRQKHAVRGATAAVHNSSSLDSPSASDELGASRARASSSAAHVLVDPKATTGIWHELRWYIQDAVFTDGAYSRSASMLLRAVFGLVLVWLISQIDFDRQARA